MRINKLGRYIRVSVSAEECRRAGSSFERLPKDNRQAGEFLASLLTDLRKRELISCMTGRIDIEVEEEGSGLLLTVSEPGHSLPAAAVVFSDPCELERLINELCSDPEKKCSLWKTDAGYALITESEDLPDVPSQRILAAKIREYGKLLSDSPKKFI